MRAKVGSAINLLSNVPSAQMSHSGRGSQAASVAHTSLYGRRCC